MLTSYTPVEVLECLVETKLLILTLDNKPIFFNAFSREVIDIIVKSPDIPTLAGALF